MVRRLISANTSEILAMTPAELKQSIKASEGRVILSENVSPVTSFIGDITNAELAAAFGADLILMNLVDVYEPHIAGLTEAERQDCVRVLKQLTGRPIGINLEPVDPMAGAAETLHAIPEGRQASAATLKKAEELGFDFVCFTGNPGTGVSNQAILSSVKIARQHFSGLIFAGKMHGAGVAEPVVNEQIITDLIDAGVDVLLVPAVGTVPGFSSEDLTKATKAAHEKGALVMSAIGTSQEGASKSVIEQMAITNKICGVDIQHIGDSGYSGLAPVENIFYLSKAIRGQRHAVSRMARSIAR